MIVTRYINKEIVWHCITISSVLLLIALSNKFVMLLAKSAAGAIPVGYVLQLVSLYIPELAVLLIPLGFFAAVLFTYSRLNSDSEMVVLFSSGFSFRDLTSITLKSAVVVAALVAILTLYVVPLSIKAREQLLHKAMVLGAIDAIVPGRFQEFGDNGTVFYIEDSSDKKSMNGAFIASKNHDKEWVVITAAKAKVTQTGDAVNNSFLVLEDGQRYTGTEDSLALTNTKFSEYGKEIIPKQKQLQHIESHKEKSSYTLWDSMSLRDNSELQWRIALPLSVIILSLWAIPLGHSRPRSDKLAKFVPAILIYIVYYNLLTIARRWIYKGVLPTYLGLWWVHTIFAAIALYLLYRKINNRT